MTPEERKARPIASGVLAYFPDAIMEVANCSFIGNQQHNPGQPLHWAREKSTDHDDALLRHETDRLAGAVFDTDGVRHRAKIAWRALAALQIEIEQERANYLTPTETAIIVEDINSGRWPYIFPMDAEHRSGEAQLLDAGIPVQHTDITTSADRMRYAEMAQTDPTLDRSLLRPMDRSIDNIGEITH